MTRQLGGGIAGIVLTASLVGLFAYSSGVGAARNTSTNYIIDASVNDSFGGRQGSDSYKLVSSGGESIIGDGSSGSYKLSAGYIAQLTEEESSDFIELSVQPSGLVAYYPLNEVSGTDIKDHSSSNNDGSTVNDPAWTTGGKLDGAITLDSAQSQRATVPYNNQFFGSALTISLWANQASLSANKSLASVWDYEFAYALDGSWALQTSETDSSVLRFFVADWFADPGDNYVDTPTGSWTANSWNHVVVVYDGSLTNSQRVKIYINGILQTTTTEGSIATSLVDVSEPLIIGDFHGLDRYWNGGIDHIKLFSRPLNDAEIKAEYAAQNAGIESGVTLGSVVAGASKTSTFDIVTETDASAYGLAIEQNHNLQFGAESISGVSGTVETPAAWSEGTTKGLGFSLASTNATAIPGKWGSGASYAAIPGSLTTFYNRTGVPSSKDILVVNLRIDTQSSQVAGDYSQTTSITGTITP